MSSNDTRQYRRLFYHRAWDGVYIEVTNPREIRRWGWMEDVTNNNYHEEEYQKFLKEHHERNKHKVTDRRYRVCAQKSN